jgi:hypothetical protein
MYNTIKSITMRKMKFVLFSVILFCAVQLNAQIGYLPFTESFENGIQKWTSSATGGTVGVTTAESIVGSQSFHMSGTATASKLTKTFSNNMAINEIMFYVRVASGDGAVVNVGDGTNNLFSGNVNSGNYVVHDINGAYALCSVNNNEWIKVEAKNINYSNNTLEVWVNDTLCFSDYTFNASVSGVSQIDLYNSTTSHEAWWDAIYLGIVDYEKPSYTGDKVCQDDTASVVFSENIAFDSLGINVLGTNFNIGPITADTTIHYTHPYFETTDVLNASWNSVWAGNMFDIIAKEDLSIYGFDIRPDNATIGTGNMKIYYRKGSVETHNTSPSGWLLHDSLSFQMNTIGGLCWVELNKPLTIPKGEVYGIYICTDNGVSYTGTGGTLVQTNDNLTLDFQHAYAGDYFNLSFTPRVWSGRIYYEVVEEQVDMAAITTMFTSNNGNYSNMVDIYAKNDIIIDSLDVNISSTGWVKIYYRNGTCVGNNTSASGWTLLDSLNVVAAGQDNPTKLALKNKLLIPAASTYALYVISEGIMRYTNDNGSNDTYTDSNMVVVCEYGGGSTLFNATADRVWNGTLYYTVRNNEAVDIGPEIATYQSTDVRGYNFEAPTDFIIKGLRVPDDNPGNQWVEIVRFNFSKPSSFVSSVTDFVSLGRWENIEGTAVIPCNIYINKGDHIGVYGFRKDGVNTPINSYASNSSPLISKIFNHDVEFHRTGANDFTTNPINNMFVSASQQVARIEMYIEDVSKHGGKDSLLLEVQNPVVNLGSDTSICAHDNISLDAGAFSVYNWSTGGSSQFEVIDSTGTGINSTDVWVSVEDQYGCEASDTITITFVVCTGIEEEILSLSVYPNPSKDVFFVNAQGLNEEMHIEVMSVEGRLVKQLVSSAITTKIDLSDQQPGMYFIRLRIGTQTQVVNVVLQ